jgi:hypothetical protein
MEQYMPSLLKSSAIALALVVGASTLADAKTRYNNVRHVRAHKAPVYGAYRSYGGYYVNTNRARNFQDTIRPY